jgi:hypothetical protein
MSEKEFCDFVFAIQNVLYVSSQGAVVHLQLCLSIDLEGGIQVIRQCNSAASRYSASADVMS